MKKVLNFLRSMRFGIILLILIAACSVVGTVIPQNREIAWYAQNYQEFHGVILMLRLNHMFESWYFITLLVLLCLNLSFCSIVRIRGVVRAGKNMGQKAAQLKNTVALDPDGVAELHKHLRGMHCREERFGETTVYHKNSFGRYGTFITHLSILLTVIFGAVALYTPTVKDQDCMPGESIFLEDGTELHVFDFHLTDEDGRLDYTSKIQMTLPNGRASDVTEIKVNYPFSFGSYKIYQQTFGTAGSVTVTDLSTGGSDDFLLRDMCFLSADGYNGVWFETLYPDYLKDPSGNVTLITLTEGVYPNPVYQIQVLSDGVYTPTLAFPGDQVQIYDLQFRFNAPVDYPGLRIKHIPRAANALLVASFTLMILGLAVTFFLEPVLVKVDPLGYAVGGTKPERTCIELGELLKAHEKRDPTEIANEKEEEKE